MTAPHEAIFCARCHDHAHFEQDESGEFLSTCCNWPAESVEAPTWMEEE